MDDSPTTRPSLLVRLRDPRDHRAWEEFVDVYGPLVRRLARRRGLQDADAADLAQDVFRAVAGAIDRWDPDPARGSFRGWLSRIARNLVVNVMAGQRRHPRGTGGTDLRLLIEAQPGPDGAEDSSLFDAEYRRRLFDGAADQVRGEFTEAAWRAFWMTGVDGVGGAEAAARLGTTVGTVYYYKSKVMARLRQVVERFEGE